MASLLVVSGSSAGDYYLLGRSEVVIGRDDGCPIQVVDETVSRRHVRVRREGPAFRAQDLESANGTLLNDHPLRDETTLCDGDIIRLGQTEMMFSEEDFADAETAFQHYRRRGEGDRSTIIS